MSAREPWPPWMNWSPAGFSLCYHFGYENAEDLLTGMNRAFDMGILDEWLKQRMGA